MPAADLKDYKIVNNGGLDTYTFDLNQSSFDFIVENKNGVRKTFSASPTDANGPILISYEPQKSLSGNYPGPQYYPLVKT